MGRFRVVVVGVGVRTSHARREIQTLCADRGLRVVVAGQRVGATRAAGEFTASVFVGRFRVVVAGSFVGATKSDAREVVAASIVNGGVGVVVAAKWVGATCARVEVTRAIQFSGAFVVVAGVRIGATWDFKGIAHAISVVVHEANPVAIVSSFWEFTCCRVDRRGVVVARRGAQATGTRGEFAAVVVDVGKGVVVACRGILTTLNGGNARTVVVGGIGVVIERIAVGASFDFVGVAHAVAVGVGQAISVTVVSRLREFAGPVVDDGGGVVVARTLVQAAAWQARKEVTRPIVRVGVGVKVASPYDGATDNLARAVVEGGAGIEVGGSGVRATVTRRKVGACGRQCGIRIVVACGFVHAARA